MQINSENLKIEIVNLNVNLVSRVSKYLRNDYIEMASVEDDDRYVRTLKTDKAAGSDAITAERLIYSHSILILIFKLLLLFSVMIKQNLFLLTGGQVSLFL